MAERGHALRLLGLPPGRRRRPAARGGAAAAPGLARRAPQGQRHRLPDRGLRHRGLRPGRDAADAPPPGLRPLARGCCGRCPTPTRLPEVLADYRVAPASLSGGKLAAAAATWTLYREVEGLGRPRAAFYLAHNLARALRQAGAVGVRSAAQEGPEVGEAARSGGGSSARRRGAPAARRGRRPGRRPAPGRGPGPRPPRRSPSSRAGAR